MANMRYTLPLLLFFNVMGILRISAQVNPSLISASALKQLQTKEDTLKDYAFYLTTDSLPEERMLSLIHI
jgi:hypothetical protein